MSVPPDEDPISAVRGILAVLLFWSLVLMAIAIIAIVVFA